MHVEGPPRESGQAAVESALVLPVVIVLSLGILQLAMLQQARLMTEYAAFQAVRAGVVWNGSNERMHDAAFTALTPTMGATHTLARFAETYARAQLTNLGFSQLGWSGPEQVNGQPLKGLIRVDTINPANYPQVAGIWNVPQGTGWEELDFDSADTYAEGAEALTARFERFSDPNLPAPDQDLLRRLNVLTIRVRYWYEMRIPFANWFVFITWFAANADVALRGALDRPTLDPNADATNIETNVTALPGFVTGVTHERGLPTATRADMLILWGLAHSSVSLPNAPVMWGGGRRFFLPLTATYSMRMQSNFHRKWLVHEDPAWGP